MTGSAQDSLPELVRLLADDAKELVRAEVGLAKVELGKTLKALLIMISVCSAGAVVAVLSLCMFIAAAVRGTGGSDAAALTSAGAFAVLLVLVSVIVVSRVLARSKPMSSHPGAAVAGSDVMASTTRGEVVR
jgi:hypothetical protein